MAIDLTRLFNPEEMAAVDRRAMESGIDGMALMECAGAAVSAAVLRHWPGVVRAVVLCGPGNNGGDGHVAARHLALCGVPVVRFGMAPKTGGDAARALAAWPGEMPALQEYEPKQGDVIVDALYGAGLDRPLEGDIPALFERIGNAGLPVLAVDLPSGLNGRTGQPMGACLKADHTVSFAAMKPGHVLMPGRQLCGAVEIADIGIPGRCLETRSGLWLNSRSVYGADLPHSDAASHKYTRGHLVVFSGPLISGGAARMAAEAGLRAGAGLVTLASPPSAVLSQAGHLTAVMQRAIGDRAALEAWISDERLTSFVLGPGLGNSALARDYAASVAANRRRLVLDADGLTAFARDREELAELGRGTELILTPHEGEFRRLFPDLCGDPGLSKIERARKAAKIANAIVIYKGADTVIAGTDGRAAVNIDAPPQLATAGSGDVLAGIAGALLAQGMPLFEAGCAAVARHSAAGRLAGQSAGAGMTAEDLISAVSLAGP